MDKTIRHVKRSQLDIEKYNGCIEADPNGAIYAYSFYLDKMAKHWDVLVMGDYELVMPVTWSKKYGFRYIYTPAFVQKLGIYGSVPVDRTLTKFLFAKAFAKFSYIDLAINFKPSEKLGRITARTNYVLPIRKNYEEIFAGYTDECKINIRKAEKRHCAYVEEMSIERVIKLYIAAYGEKNKAAKQRDYDNFMELCRQLRKDGKLLSCGVVHEQTGELLFGALVARSNARLFYVMGAPSEHGRRARAGYYCLDQVIRSHAGKADVFDFEGSDIDNVARFYLRFGPVNERYYHLTINKLKWPFRLFKK